MFNCEYSFNSFDSERDSNQFSSSVNMSSYVEYDWNNTARPSAGSMHIQLIQFRNTRETAYRTFCNSFPVIAQI